MGFQASRYIFVQITAALLVVTLVVTTALWLIYSLRFLDYIVDDGLSIGTFLTLVFLTLPRFLGIGLPIALFCAILFVYNKLLSDNELVVLRASGFSDPRLSLPPLLLALLVAGAVALVNLIYAPLAARAFKDLQFTVRNDMAGLLIQPGVFKALHPGVTFYVREQFDRQSFGGILIHDERDERAPVTMMAARGSVTLTPTGLRVFLVDGNRQQVDRRSGRLSLLYFEQYGMDLVLGGATADDRWRDAGERSLPELLSATPQSVGPAYGKFRAEGHQRLASILEAPALAAVALAMLLVGEFSRRGHGRRIGLAVALALTVKAGGLAAKAIVARTPVMAPLLYLVPLTALCGSALLLLRPTLRHDAVGTQHPAGAA